MSRSRRALFLAIAVALAAPAAACSSTATTSTATSAPRPSGGTAQGGTTAGTVAPVARDILGQIPAPNAPGKTEYSMRVTIQPKVKLPTHRHPGIQVARIESGVLTYTIVSGTAGVARANAPVPGEQVTGPNEVVLRAGDTVYEDETLVHYAENKGDEPVVVTLAALFTTGEDVSINVAT